MKQLKTFGVLSFAFTFAWISAGCTSGDAPVKTSSFVTRPMDTPMPALQPTATLVPTGAAPAPGPIEGQSAGAGQPQTPITTKLLMSHVPMLQEATALTMTITTTLDAPDMTAVISLHDGATLLSGDATWQGQLQAGQIQTLHAVVQFHTEGDWILQAKALSPQPNGDIWGDASTIYLHVAEDASHLGFEPVDNLPGSGAQGSPAVYPAPVP